MLNVYCWRCGTKINEENVLGLGHFDQNIGRYRGKGFVAFNCPKCNKARYQILDANYTALQKSISKTLHSGSPEVIDIDQVIDFHKMLNEINTIDSFLEMCETTSRPISTEMKKPILQPADVYNLFIELNSYSLKRLMILTLDKDNYLVSWEFLGEGSNRPISFEPKTIFHTPFLLDEQVSIIIAQNLYTNFTQPTQKDIMMTKRLIKAGKIIGVEFLDHIVIEKNGYYSYDQLNYI